MLLLAKIVLILLNFSLLLNIIILLSKEIYATNALLILSPLIFVFQNCLYYWAEATEKCKN